MTTVPMKITKMMHFVILQLLSRDLLIWWRLLRVQLQGFVDEPLLLPPLNQMNDSDSGQAELFFEFGRVLGVSMEGRVDEVCQLVCEFLMKDTPYNQQSKPKPNNRNFSKGAREIKRLQSSVNYDGDGSKLNSDVKFIKL